MGCSPCREKSRFLTPAQAVIGFACAYEMTAILSKKVPTITMLCRQHRWLEASFLSWLIIHLHRDQETRLRKLIEESIERRRVR